MKEHFFDKIVVSDKKRRQIKVYTSGTYKLTFDNLYFHFTCDYAQCLAKMEHDLFMQTRKARHYNYDFIFDEDYVKPTLFSVEDIKGLDKYDNL